MPSLSVLRQGGFCDKVGIVVQKRVFLALLLGLCLLLSGCTSPEDAMVKETVEVLKAAYAERYETGPMRTRSEERGIPFEGYLEILDTRVYYIKDSFQLADEDDQLVAEKTFGNVRCVVEFSLYTDGGFAPYYPSTDLYDCVIVYRDGSMEAEQSPFLTLVYQRYRYELMDVIESVSDRNGDFNGIWRLAK